MSLSRSVRAVHSCRFWVHPRRVDLRSRRSAEVQGDRKYKEIVTVMWRNAPVGSWDDEWDLADVYDPEADLLDDLYASGD